MSDNNEPTIHDWQPSEGYIDKPFDEDAERAAFEAEFSQAPFEWTFERQGWACAWPGQYIGYYIETAWRGWLAKAKQGQSEPARQRHTPRNRQADLGHPAKRILRHGTRRSCCNLQSQPSVSGLEGGVVGAQQERGRVLAWVIVLGLALGALAWLYDLG